MITPAYSTTATERVLPRLALDFTTGSLDSRVTLTRALNTATRVNSSGVVEIVNADLPRFDYDPVTLAPKGLLIEEQRTNRCAYSQTPSDVNWLIAAGASKTSTNNPDPFGTSSALLLTADGANTQHFMLTSNTNTVSYTSGTTYTISCFVKPNTATIIQITGPAGVFTSGNYANFSLTGNGSVTAVGNGTATITPFPNGYYRISLTVTATTTTTTNAGAIAFITSGTDVRVPSNTSSGSVYVTGWQSEVGAFATSYIPNLTTGSTTRNADNVSMTGTNFSSWFNQPQGTIYSDATSYFVPANTYPALWNVGLVNDNTKSSITAFYEASRTQPGFSARNDNSTLLFNANFAGSSDNKLIIGYKSGSYQSALNASAATTLSTSSTVPTPNSVFLGQTVLGAQNFSGHFKKFFYWPQKLTANELQAFTK